MQVSLTVDGELAEAISEVLDRFTSGGVVVESDVRYKDAEDEGTAFGPVSVFGYLIIDNRLEQNRQKLEEALWHLHTIRELPQAEYKEIADENWISAWKDRTIPSPSGRNYSCCLPGSSRWT